MIYLGSTATLSLSLSLSLSLPPSHSPEPVRPDAVADLQSLLDLSINQFIKTSLSPPLSLVLPLSLSPFCWSARAVTGSTTM
jgi:hypothetical protein